MTEPSRPRWGRPFLLGMLLLSILASLGMIFQTLDYSRYWIAHNPDDLSFMAPERMRAEPTAQHVVDRTKAKPKNTGTNKVIAYAISVTECSATASSYLDGAAVIAYAIDRHSIRNPKSGSKYDYKLFGFLHADARNCSDSLSSLGYEVQIRPTPIKVEDIRGPHKEFVGGAGCCGAKEFIKLYSYTLTDYPIVVHFDTDMLLLKPLDVLFDSMLEGPSSPARERLPAMWTKNNTELPKRIEAFFTRDYNMMLPGSRATHQTAVQGGFLVVRPNVTQFEMYREIILEGDYQPADGWGSSKGLRFGSFYGAPQIQGLCTYFFGHVRPGYSVELNRCRINNMADGPYATEKGHEGECRTQEKECEDCQKTNLSDIILAHYTICTKPWWCREPKKDLCGDMLNEWHMYRFELEGKWSREYESYNTTAARLGSLWDGKKGRDTFCRGEGRYTPIQYPKGIADR